MGVDMTIMVLAMPHGRAVDWDAAGRALRAVNIAALWGADDIYPWELWLEDAQNLPSARAAHATVRAAQECLGEYADVLRGAIDHGRPDQLMAFSLPTHRVWLTGGPSAGDPPTEMVNPVIELAEAGVLAAAGFTDLPAYVSRRPDDRPWPFQGDESRCTLAGLATVHAADQADSMEHPAYEASALNWFDALRAELRTDQPGRQLLRFAARALATATWLLDPSETLDLERLDETARDVCLMIDGSDFEESELRQLARYTSHGEALKDVLTSLEELCPRFEDLAEEQVDSDEDLYASPLDEDLAAEIKLGPLIRALAALADLEGPGLDRHLDVTQRVESPTFGPSSPSDWLENWFAVLVVDNAFDTHRLQRAAAERDETARTLSAELDEVLRGQYRGHSTVQWVGDVKVVIAAPHTYDVPDVFDAIALFGRAGLLDEAGAIWWHAPAQSK